MRRDAHPINIDALRHGTFALHASRLSSVHIWIFTKILFIRRDIPDLGKCRKSDDYYNASMAETKFMKLFSFDL